MSSSSGAGSLGNWDGRELTLNARDVDAFRASPYRRLVLRLILEERYGPVAAWGPALKREPEIKMLVTIVLHGSATAVERIISFSGEPSRIRDLLEQAGYPRYPARS